MQRMVHARLDLLFQNLLDLVGIVVVHRRRAHGVADEFDGLMIGQNPGVFAEKRRVCRGFDMFFYGHRVLACHPDKLEQQAKQIAVVVRLPLRPLEDLLHVFQRVLDRRAVVRQHERTCGGTGDHDHLERKRLEDDPKLASGRHVATEDHDEDDGDSDKADHAVLSFKGSVRSRPDIRRHALRNPAIPPLDQFPGAAALRPASSALMA